MLACFQCMTFDSRWQPYRVSSTKYSWSVQHWPANYKHHRLKLHRCSMPGSGTNSSLRWPRKPGSGCRERWPTSRYSAGNFFQGYGMCFPLLYKGVSKLSVMTSKTRIDWDKRITFKATKMGGKVFMVLDFIYMCLFSIWWLLPNHTPPLQEPFIPSFQLKGQSSFDLSPQIQISFTLRLSILSSVLWISFLWCSWMKKNLASSPC